MSDATGPDTLRLTVHADVRVQDPGRLAGRSEAELPQLLAELIRRHAWEAGLEIADPASVRVDVSRRS